MSVIVKGRNIAVTPALKQYAEKKIEKLTKQFKTVGDITAVLKVENGNHVVEFTVPANGIILRAQESTKDMYSSIDLVEQKIERQIHKYKTKLMRRKYTNFQDPTPVPPTESEEGEFKIIRNKSFTLLPMNAEEAILQMNLLNHDFFVFYDPDLGAVNVVYRRKDGNYGLLSPKLK
jgi:putative sigma-54 modulation protein